MPREYVGQRIFEPNKTHKLCLQFPSASLIETKRYEWGQKNSQAMSPIPPWQLPPGQAMSHLPQAQSDVPVDNC